MKILFGSLQNFTFSDLVADFLCRMADPCRFFCHHFVAEFCALRFRLFFYGFYAARDCILC